MLTLNAKTGWREVEIGRGSSDQTCPVHALEQWLHFAKIDFGPVFVRTSRDGKKALETRLSDKHVARLIKSTVLKSGIRGELPEKDRLALFSGHSLRAGLASSAEVDERYVQKQLGHALSEADQEALTDLYVRGTPKNTLRAYERDLLYITTWKAARFKDELKWPETEEVALAFILDHSRDLRDENDESEAWIAAQDLVLKGLRKTLACPAPSTLDRRIASWQAFHRMKNLNSPFDAPALRQARSKSRKAAARKSVKKSQNPITRDVLEDLLKACDHSLRGVRDKAILMLGWASEVVSASLYGAGAAVL